MRAQELAQPDDDAAVLAGASADLERSRPTDAASQLAAEIKARLAAGDGARARELFGDLVGLHQRRANRIAVPGNRGSYRKRPNFSILRGQFEKGGSRIT